MLLAGLSHLRHPHRDGAGRPGGPDMVLTAVGWSDQASLLALSARGTLRMSSRKLGCRVRCSGLTVKMGVPAVAELGLSQKITASWAIACARGRNLAKVRPLTLISRPHERSEGRLQSLYLMIVPQAITPAAITAASASFAQKHRN